jgi:hypothetical protein
MAPPGRFPHLEHVRSLAALAREETLDTSHVAGPHQGLGAVAEGDHVSAGNGIEGNDASPPQPDNQLAVLEPVSVEHVLYALSVFSKKCRLLESRV